MAFPISACFMPLSAGTFKKNDDVKPVVEKDLGNVITFSE